MDKLKRKSTAELPPSFGSDGRLGKLRRGIAEKAVQERRLRRALLVACHVRVVIVGPVRVAITAVRSQPGNWIRRRGASTGPARRVAFRNKRVLVDNCKRITALENARAGEYDSAFTLPRHLETRTGGYF